MCRVVGVLPTATPVYSWTCKGGTCTGSQLVSNNRLSIGVINNNHQGEFTCTVSGSGVTTQSGTFNLQVTGEMYDCFLQCGDALYFLCLSMPIKDHAKRPYQ